jgi:hypothetical protein
MRAPGVGKDAPQSHEERTVSAPHGRRGISSHCGVPGCAFGEWACLGQGLRGGAGGGPSWPRGGSAPNRRGLRHVPAHGARCGRPCPRLWRGLRADCGPGAGTAEPMPCQRSPSLGAQPWPVPHRHRFRPRGRRCVARALLGRAASGGAPDPFRGDDWTPLETTEPREAYFGYLLDDQEAEDFCFFNV